MVIQIYASLFFLVIRPLTHADQVCNPGGESGRCFPSSLLLTAEIKALICPVYLFQLVAFLECFDDCKGVCFVDCGFDACSPSLSSPLCQVAVECKGTTYPLVSPCPPGRTKECCQKMSNSILMLLAFQLNPSSFSPVRTLSWSHTWRSSALVSHFERTILRAVSGQRMLW